MPSDNLSDVVDMVHGALTFEMGMNRSYDCDMYGSSSMRSLRKDLSKETYFVYAKKEGIMYDIMDSDDLSAIDLGDVVVFYGSRSTPEEFFRDVVDFKRTYNEVFGCLGSKLNIIYRNSPDKPVDLSNARDIVLTRSERQEYYAA